MRTLSLCPGLVILAASALWAGIATSADPVKSLSAAEQAVRTDRFGNPLPERALGVPAARETREAQAVLRRWQR